MMQILAVFYLQPKKHAALLYLYLYWQNVIAGLHDCVTAISVAGLPLRHFNG